MGAIQQAINQMASSTLGAAVGVKAAQMANEQKKSTEVEKQKAEIEKQKAADLKRAQDISITQQDIAAAKTDLSKIEQGLSEQNTARKENLTERQKLKGEIVDKRYEQELLTTEERYEGRSEEIENAISKKEKQIGHLNYERKKINAARKQLMQEQEAKKISLQGSIELLEKLKGGAK